MPSLHTKKLHRDAFQKRDNVVDRHDVVLRLGRPLIVNR